MKLTGGAQEALKSACSQLASSFDFQNLSVYRDSQADMTNRPNKKKNELIWFNLPIGYYVDTQKIARSLDKPVCKNKISKVAKVNLKYIGGVNKSSPREISPGNESVLFPLIHFIKI